jgi:hypothetical protein
VQSPLMAPIASPAERGPGILASAATGLAAHLARQGGDVDRICGRVGVDPAVVGQPTISLELSAYCALFEEAARQTGYGNFGLAFGREFKPRDLGLIGYAAVSAVNLGAALETLVQLFAHHQQSTHLALSSLDAELVKLEYRIEAPDILERRQDAELSLGMFLNLLRESLGPSFAPEEVHFEHPKPEGWKEHESAFDAPAYFSQVSNALVFRRTVLGQPMPAPDLKLLSITRMCLQSMGAAPAARPSVLGKVKAAVRARLPEGYPDLETVAAQTGLAGSTIQRELAREKAESSE